MTMIFRSSLLALLLVGCDLDSHDKPQSYWYKWECTVQRVEGTFVTRQPREYRDGMVRLYRFNEEGKRRDFMFPIEMLERCEHKPNG